MLPCCACSSSALMWYWLHLHCRGIGAMRCNNQVCGSAGRLACRLVGFAGVWCGTGRETQVQAYIHQRDSNNNLETPAMTYSNQGHCLQGND